MKKHAIPSESEAAEMAQEMAMRGMRGQRDDARRAADVARKALEHLQGKFDQLAAIKKPMPVQPFKAAKSSADRSAGVSLCMWSDWHVAEVVSPRMVSRRNAYNPAIARKRAARCVESTVKIHRHLARSYAVDSMVLFLGGDFITGYLHPELEQTNAMGPVEEAYLAKELLTAALDRLLEEKSIRHLRIVCIRGNHGRTTKKIQFKNDYATSLESFLYWTLRDHYPGGTRVTFEVPESDVHEITVVDGWKLRLFHGHQIRYNDGIGGLTIPLQKWLAKQDRTNQVDFNLMGHYHTYSIPTPRTILNGSLKGWDEYAASHGFPFQEPLQAFALLDVKRRMVAQHLPIFCS